LNDFFKELEEKNYKIQNRVMLSRYRGKTKCYLCGKRLRIEASYVKKINAKTVSDLVDLPLNIWLLFRKY
jgi:excinuclease ABC subunit A